MSSKRISAQALFVLVAFLLLQIESSLFAEKKNILLWPEGAPGAVGTEDKDKPLLIPYPADPKNNTGAAIVVCPGGGYGHLAMDHEGHQVAKWLNSFGVSAFILKYRIAPRYHYPAPILDAQRALRTVRSRAQEWKIDASRIGILGFSAGGHLASSAGTHFDMGKKDAKDPIDRVSCRPDFMVLVYPVISFTTEYTHKGSRRNFCGEKLSTDLMEKFSNEKQVTDLTPPTFLMHSSGDKPVPPENSILFYMALRKFNIPAELHIYEQGRHGYGLGGNDPVLRTWPKRCQDWLGKRGLLKKKVEVKRRA